MSLKQEIETWVTALVHYENNEFLEALNTFGQIPDTSKILFNCGVIHATLGEHEKAVEFYQRAVRLDQYLAVAYFQQGVSNFLIGDFEEALANFNDTLLYLRGNNMIDYAQLGLTFKLYSCEVLFNRGLCYIYLQQIEAGMQDLQFAAKEKVVEDHSVIDEAIKEKAEGYTVFSIPVGIVYRPNAAKVKNLKTKDYLGRAKLVAASDRSNTFTGFAGAEIKSAARAAAARDDRPPENISFAAANLVKPGLSSKRQQSEPPLNRNVFPPTPPPESERSLSGTSSLGSQISRGTSLRVGNSRPIPAKLNIEKALPPQRYQIQEESQPEPTIPRRLGTARAASESRGPMIRREESLRRDMRNLSRRRRSDQEHEDEFSNDILDMYRNSRGAAKTRFRAVPEQLIMEDDREDEDLDEVNFNENDFEIVGRGGIRAERGQPPPAQPPPTRPSRRPDIRKVRVKVHTTEDTRYLMIDTNIEFAELQDRIRDKFAFRRRFKLKIREDDLPHGDMITMGDQDDLDLALMSVKANAKGDNADMGKMDIWVQEI